ncbi:centromere protein X [Syncephalis plumigaleata]|nr:centromere protein X [Syncephalis plumigaleata]
MASHTDPMPFEFKEATINHVFKQGWQHPQTKIHKDASSAAKLLITLFTEEAIMRATEEAKQDPSARRLDVEHLEKIAPQLILDI